MTEWQTKYDTLMGQKKKLELEIQNLKIRI